MADWMQIQSEDDIYLALHSARVMMNELSFSEMNQQKVIVSVSELTRNILDHAESRGYVSFEFVEGRGIRITVQDRGKGISNLDRVMSGEAVQPYRGLGLGLAGAKRMMDQFEIYTSKEGTKIVCTKWK
ncbi:hypothetical protein D3P08_24400 [Paenibacillus nanensis]|uniref:Histidine kinase/HSP90-like ATPase domain-containing protein n=1 Tax=Paenibacillus nanensis TaxID=393251 RepID=A0A3A1ULG5_9BACL|nr:ATP-binding protein [Paenibacillus nanensis]RIX48644.1 hypothetical protein D3P08_24400 [Paenibacillus nanensis]